MIYRMFRKILGPEPKEWAPIYGIYQCQKDIGERRLSTPARFCGTAVYHGVITVGLISIGTTYGPQIIERLF